MQHVTSPDVILNTGSNGLVQIRFITTTYFLSFPTFVKKLLL